MFGMSCLNRCAKLMLMLLSAALVPLMMVGLFCGCGITADSQIPPPIKPIAAVVDMGTTAVTAPLWLMSPTLRNEVKKNYNVNQHKRGGTPDPGPVLIYKADDRSVSNNTPTKIEH